MKLNRRKFFAAAAGAATAVPSLAQGGMMPRTGMQFPPSAPMGYANRLGDQCETGGSSTYIQDRIAQIKRQLNGEFTEDEERQILRHVDRNAVAVANLDALKSMSMAAKRNALNQMFLDRHRQDWIENAKRELAHLTKQALGF